MQKKKKNKKTKGKRPCFSQILDNFVLYYQIPFNSL